MVCGHKWPLFNARSSTSRKRRPAQRSKLGQPHKARAKLVSRRAKKQGRPGGAGTGLVQAAPKPYGQIDATLLLMASNAFLAPTWLAFTLPYQTAPASAKGSLVFWSASIAE